MKLLAAELTSEEKKADGASWLEITILGAWRLRPEWRESALAYLAAENARVRAEAEKRHRDWLESVRRREEEEALKAAGLRAGITIVRKGVEHHVPRLGVAAVRYAAAHPDVCEDYRVRDRPLEAPGVDLRGVDLHGAYLRGANLQGANLEGADLRGADLEEADLRGVKLERANLEGARLRYARWTGPAPSEHYDVINGKLALSYDLYGRYEADHLFTKMD